MLGLDDSTDCYYGDIGDLVVINTPDIDCSIRFLDDMNIVIGNATIGTPINK